VLRMSGSRPVQSSRIHVMKRKDEGKSRVPQIGVMTQES